MADPGLRQRKQALSDVAEPTDTEMPIKTTDAHKAFNVLKFIILLISTTYLYFRLKPAVLDLPIFRSAEVLHGTKPGVTPVLEADEYRRDAVVKAYKWAWSAYVRDAMGDDDYNPISKHGSNLSEAGGIGYFVVDVIDTMQIMHLDAEYEYARIWVRDKLSFDRDGEFSTFETTIRVLGGLLSAYHFSGDSLFLDKAVELADRMLPVFDTKLGLPKTSVNLRERKGLDDKHSPGIISTAEAATLQLEFKYLSHLTENEIYWEKAEKVMKVIKNARSPYGLAPIFISEELGQFVTSDIRLGSRGDSYYEYLLKQHLQTQQTEAVYREMYESSVQAIHDRLVQKSMFSGLTYTLELIPDRWSESLNLKTSPKQDHLVCFLGGTLMLGAVTTGALVSPVSVPPLASELTPTGRRDWKTGYELIETCMQTHNTSTGLSPEIAYFRTPDDGFGKVDQDWYIKGHMPGAPPPYDARYMLRPETVESLFVAFRLTGDSRYRDYGWHILNAINRHCKIKTGGFATVLDVQNKESEMEDKMETFFLSETLKYLYLLFDDANVLPLDQYVFNTEAHPLPVFTPSIRTGFS